MDVGITQILRNYERDKQKYSILESGILLTYNIEVFYSCLTKE